MDFTRLAIVSLVAIVNVGLAVAVFVRNPRGASNRAFAYTVLLIVSWLFVAYLSDQDMLAAHALVLNRLTFALGMLMGSFLLRFTAIFPSRNARLSAGWNVHLWLGCLLAAATLSTPLFVADVEFRPSGTDIVAGPGFVLLAVWVLVGIVASALAVRRRFRAASGRQRAQLKFMGLGVVTFAAVAALLGLLLPALTGSYELAQLNTFSTLILVSLTTYAIIKHRLMDIRLVVLRGTAYALLITLLGAGLVLIASLTHAYLAPALGIDSEILFALFSLVTVLVFRPLHNFVERSTDRFFYRRTYDPVHLLNHLGSEMASTLDERELALLLSREIAAHMRLDFGAIAFRSGDRVLVSSSRGAYEGPDLFAWLERHRPASGYVIADDFEPDDQAIQVLTEADIRVLAPLYGEGVLIGALALGGKRSGVMFSEQDVRFLEVLVPEAAIAMKNAHLFDERNRRVRELTALNQLAFALGSSIELDEMLGSALQQVCTVTAADSGSIMLLDSETQTLSIAASLGVDDEIVASTHIPVGHGVAGWVAEQCTPLTLPDDAGPSFANELLREDIVSSICAPVVAKDRVIGVLSVNRRESSELFANENLHVVTSFAGQLGIAIENARLYADLEKTFLGTIGALAAAVDAKDPYTFGHSNEVTIHAVAIAEHLGLDEDEVDMIRIAATLHDIGKIGIDGAILLKPGALTPEEREIINQHPAIGADILAPLDFLRDTVPYILFHHERYSGGGYPTGISGDAIPFGARIIAVADSFNAMVSDRPYRKGLTLEEAMGELRDNAGTQFDPDVAAAFLEILEAEQRASTAEAAPQSPITTAARR